MSLKPSRDIWKHIFKTKQTTKLDNGGALQWQRQTDFWVWGQPDLYSEFQARQVCIVKSCLTKPKKPWRVKTRNKQKGLGEWPRGSGANALVGHPTFAFPLLLVLRWGPSLPSAGLSPGLDTSCWTSGTLWGYTTSSWPATRSCPFTLQLW